MQKVRIKLDSTDIKILNSICNNIKEIAKKSGVLVSGPIPLPTKKLKITTRKSPCGDGTATFDRYEMRIHKRLIDLPANEKVLRQIMKMQFPKNINIKIEIKDWGFYFSKKSYIPLNNLSTESADEIWINSLRGTE